MIHAVLQYQFLQHALLAAFFASIVCGIIGVIVVEKRMIMMSGGIAHASYGGVGLGYLLGFEPIWGAFSFAILAALGISYMKKKEGIYPDILIGLFWSVGMALGILFVSWMPGYPPDMSSYLFGNILSVTQSEVRLIMVLSMVTVFFVILCFQVWKAYLFDEEFACVIKLNTTFLGTFLFVLIALATVILIRVVGIILVIALLTAPAAISSLWFSHLKTRMVSSVLLCLFFCTAGLWLSYDLNIPSGATMVILSGTGYLLSLGFHQQYKKRIQRNLVQRSLSGKDLKK